MAHLAQTQHPNATGNLLLVDDDPAFCHALGAALRRRGFQVRVAHDVTHAEALAQDHVPSHAVVDLRMPGQSGLSLVKSLKQLNESVKIVVLTGFASVTTAVEAIKLGATYYLTKPADADEVVEAFGRDEGDDAADIPEQHPSIAQVEREHLHKVLKECGGNISEAARKLRMHRRTFQRKLQKTV